MTNHKPERGTPLEGDVTIFHGVFQRPDPRTMFEKDPDNFPRIVQAYRSSKPGSTTGMMLVRDEFGTSSRNVDYAHMEAWFSQHHDSVFDTADGKRTFCICRITPRMLAAYFEHETSTRPLPEATRKVPKAFELGHLIDPGRHPLGFQYARRDWAPAIAAGITQPDGTVKIEAIPAK